MPFKMPMQNLHIQTEIQQAPKRLWDRFGACIYFAMSASGSAFNWIATVAIALPPVCREDVTLTAHAYDEVTVGDVVYAVYEDHAEAIVPKYHLDKSLGADPEMPAELVFADEVEGVPVTVIPYDFSYYFKSDKDKLTKIKLPSSLSEIKKEAFKDCTGLTEITLPDTLETLGDSAFSGCFSLKDVTIPKSVTKIKPQAFGAEASYGEPGTLVPWLKGRTVVVNGFLLNIVIPQDGVLVIPDGVTDIGGVSVVNNQKITSIEFPESVKSISSFTALPKLTSVIIRSDDCEITDGAFGSPMGWDPDTDKPFYTYNPACTVYCNADSTAAAYAKEKGFQTAPLPEKVTVPETTTTSTTTTSSTTTTTSTSAAQPTTTTVTTTTTTAAVSTTADTTTSASVTGTTETQESVTTATTETAPPAVEDSRGDINADGEISVADAQLALNAYVKRWRVRRPV